MWALRVAEEAITTLGFDEAADWGLDPYDLVCPPQGYERCQEVGKKLLSTAEPPMLRVPSAALPGTWNLIVFGLRVVAPYDGAVADPGLDVPAGPLAVDSRALEELVPLVRPLDDIAHAAHDAWASGQPFELVDPQTLSLGG